MKLKDLEIFVVAPPFPGWGGRYWIFTKVTTDNGIVGYGECYASTVGPKAMRAVIEDVFERHMLGENPGKINEEVTDLVGEITNMVTGGAKNLLGQKGYEFEMATPMVVSGKGHTISHKANGTKIIMPFTSPHGTAYIEICFEN